MVRTLSPLVTLLGAIIGLSAITLIPGKTDIKEGKTQRFTSWGKNAIITLAVVLLAMAGAVLYMWMSSDSDEMFSIGNALLFLGMGIGLVVNNFVVSDKIKKAAKEKEPSEVHEVEAMPTEEAPAPKPAAAPKKVAKKKAKPAAPKAPQPAKDEKPAEPAVEAAELIEGPKVCPSCDTPIEHSHDGTCPVCGASVQK